MGNYGNGVLNALLVLEDSVSTYLKYYYSVSCWITWCDKAWQRGLADLG